MCGNCSSRSCRWPVCKWSCGATLGCFRIIQTDGNAMFLEGQLEDGRVVLDAPTDLPNGTRVRVEPVPLLVDPPPKKHPHRQNESRLRASRRSKQSWHVIGKTRHRQDPHWRKGWLRSSAASMAFRPMRQRTTTTTSVMDSRGLPRMSREPGFCRHLVFCCSA